jgi:hypothetical protein
MRTSKMQFCTIRQCILHYNFDNAKINEDFYLMEGVPFASISTFLDQKNWSSNELHRMIIPPFQTGSHYFDQKIFGF